MIKIDKLEVSASKPSSENSFRRQPYDNELSRSFKDISGHTPQSKKSHLAFKAVNVFKSFVGSSILTLPFYNKEVG